jgi:hypothetical protein
MTFRTGLKGENEGVCVLHVYDHLISLFILFSQNIIHHVVGAMNKRFSPAYMANMIAQSVTSLLGFGSWSAAGLLDTWLRDSLACTHTDLIYFSKGEIPRMFCFSPFQTRPLGKELPSLLTSCDCKGAPAGDGPPSSRQKIWKVTHTGKHKSSLENILVKASCSICRRQYKLQAPYLKGTLHKYGGLYAAEVPYFLD